MTRLSDLAARLAGLEADSLRRSRRLLQSPQGVVVTIDGRECVSFCSNDYLGLAAHPEIARAVAEGLQRHGTGAGASHLLTGHSDAHESLERALARFSGFPAALLFSTGYMANLGVATALLGRGDAVFGDRLNHACLNDGALLSRATFHRHPHGDLAALERQLAASAARVRMIMVDGVFSMDGDIAPLPELLDLAARYDAWLLVDDAHGFGVLGDGRGSLAHYGIEPSEVLDRVIYMGTLGKAAGVFGAFVAAAPEVVDTLVQSARTYVFTTALPPMLACGLQASLLLIEREPQRRAHLGELVRRWQDGVRGLRSGRALSSSTAIQPWLVGASAEAVALSASLAERGLLVPAIRPPTVPAGSARLRISLSAAHTLEQVDRLCAAMHEIDARHG